MLYELVTGELQRWEIAPSYQKLLARTKIQFYQTIIQGVDLETRLVKLQGGGQLAYDYLVLAVGIEACLDRVTGAATYALPFRTVADAERLKEQLRILEVSNRRRLRLTIVGGGPSGVELACKLAERLLGRGQVELIEMGKEILQSFPPYIRAAAHRALKARGVQVHFETCIEAIEPQQIILVRKAQMTTLPVDLVLWTAGNRSIEWVRKLACRHNSQGQVLALPTLQLVDYPEVFALGDLAESRDARDFRVPATAQAAWQQADCAARNIRAALTSRPLQRFRFRNRGDMLTLGKETAVVSSSVLNLEGRLAGVIRRLVYSLRLPTLRHRLQVFRYLLVSWVLKRLRHCWRQLRKLAICGQTLVSKGSTPYRRWWAAICWRHR